MHCVSFLAQCQSACLIVPEGVLSVHWLAYVAGGIVVAGGKGQVAKLHREWAEVQ